MRKIIGIAAALAALIPPAVQARSQAQLDCGVQRAPTGIGDTIAAAMITADRARLSPLQQTLGRAMRPCVAANRMSDAQAEAYYNYLLARLPREALSRQLARAGIVTARIDAAMGFGPGRPNMAMRDMDEAEAARASAALSSAGIRKQRLTAANWQKVVIYMDLTPRMYRYLQALG